MSESTSGAIVHGVDAAPQKDAEVIPTTPQEWFDRGFQILDTALEKPSMSAFDWTKSHEEILQLASSALKTRGLSRAVPATPYIERVVHDMAWVKGQPGYETFKSKVEGVNSLLVDVLIQAGDLEEAEHILGTYDLDYDSRTLRKAELAGGYIQGGNNDEGYKILEDIHITQITQFQLIFETLSQIAPLMKDRPEDVAKLLSYGHDLALKIPTLGYTFEQGKITALHKLGAIAASVDNDPDPYFEEAVVCAQDPLFAKYDGRMGQDIRYQLVTEIANAQLSLGLDNTKTLLLAEKLAKEIDDNSPLNKRSLVDRRINVRAASLYDIARSYAKSGHIDDARAVLKRNELPSDQDGLNKLYVEYLLEQHKADEGVSIAREIEGQTSREAAFASAAKVYASLGQKDKAELCMDDIKSGYVRDNAQEAIVSGLVGHGDFAEAISFARGIEDMRGSAIAVPVAKAYISQGNMEEAFRVISDISKEYQRAQSFGKIGAYIAGIHA